MRRPLARQVQFRRERLCLNVASRSSSDPGQALRGRLPVREHPERDVHQCVPANDVGRIRLAQVLPECVRHSAQEPVPVWHLRHRRANVLQVVLLVPDNVTSPVALRKAR